MKVLAISHSCVVDVNQELYVALARAGARVELVVPARWNDAYARNKKPQLLTSITFPVHQLSVWKPGQLMLHFYRSGLSRIVKNFQPDIIFLDEEPGSLVAAQISALCVRRKIPFSLYTKQNIRKNYPPPFGFIEKLTYRCARAILALSPEVEQVLRAKGFRGGIQQLAHGCDLSLFHTQKNLELRAKLGLHALTIGYLGRFVPEKGLHRLVEAAAILRDQKLDFQVLMVGSGSQEAELRALVARYNLEKRFVWTGAVPHHKAGDYLRCMDIFALPSLTKPHWKEQFGRVLIEAMACGVAIVASDSGYIPELIHKTGGGLIFREDDAPDCARALQTLLDNADKRAELGRIGTEAVRAGFTYEAVGTRLFEVLKSSLHDLQ